MYIWLAEMASQPENSTNTKESKDQRKQGTDQVLMMSYNPTPFQTGYTWFFNLVFLSLAISIPERYGAPGGSWGISRWIFYNWTFPSRLYFSKPIKNIFQKWLNSCDVSQFKFHFCNHILYRNSSKWLAVKFGMQTYKNCIWKSPLNIDWSDD